MTERPDPIDNPTRPTVARWRLVLAIAPAEGEEARQARGTAWDAAIRTCGLPVAGLDADPPKPRHAAAAPLSGSIAGEAELVDIWLTERLPRWRVREALERAMPGGTRLVDLGDVWLGEPALPGRVVASVFRAGLPAGSDADALRPAIAAMLAATEIRRERAKGNATIAYDLRPFIADLELVAAGAAGPGTGPSIRMTLRHDPERGIGRPDEVLAELGARTGGAPVVAESIVRKSLVLGEARPAAPPPPRRPGSRPAPRR